MRRGTTPYITIRTNQSLTGYSAVVVTIEDNMGTEISVDNKSGRMEITGSQVVVKLTQEQTLALSKGGLKLQIRAADSAGENAIASNIMTGRMEDILKEGVLSG